jgi:hypothetical protein
VTGDTRIDIERALIAGLAETVAEAVDCSPERVWDCVMSQVESGRMRADRSAAGLASDTASTYHLLNRY